MARTNTTLRTRWTLIRRLKDLGDQQSWQEFFDTYWRLIYSVARRAGLSEEDAQDVVQDTLLSLVRKLPEFTVDPAAGSFKSWLLTLVRWRVIDRLRARAKAGRPHRLTPSVPTRVPSGSARDETGTRTSTVARIPDPHGVSLDALWEAEWREWSLREALRRVRAEVDPAQFQWFEFHAVQGWPAWKVAAKFGVSLARVYFAKYKIQRLIKSRVKRLEQHPRHARL